MNGQGARRVWGTRSDIVRRCVIRIDQSDTVCAVFRPLLGVDRSTAAAVATSVYDLHSLRRTTSGPFEDHTPRCSLRMVAGPTETQGPFFAQGQSEAEEWWWIAAVEARHSAKRRMRCFMVVEAWLPLTCWEMGGRVGGIGGKVGVREL